MRKLMFLSSIFGSSFLGGGSRLRAAEGSPPPADDKPKETPATGTPADKPKEEPAMTDAVKGALDSVGKLSDDELVKFQSQLSTWTKAKNKALANGSNPDEAARIAALETELAGLKKSASDMQVEMTAIKHKLSAGAENVTLNPTQKDQGDVKPKAKGLATVFNEGHRTAKN